MAKKAHFPGVNKIKDRHGNVKYHYHRRTGIKLTAEYGSPEFAAEWAKAEASVRKDKRPKIDKTSYLSLLTAYKADAAWTSRKPRTQADYQKVMDFMLNIGAGSKPASALTQSRCEKIIDMALKERGWRFGKYVLEVNRMLYNWVLKKSSRQEHWGNSNPWANIPIPERPKNSKNKKVNRAWTAEEFAIVLAEAPLGLSRAYALGICGFDGSTMYELTWEDYQNGTLQPERKKTGVTGQVIVPKVLRPLFDTDERPSDYIITNFQGNRFKDLNTMQTRSSALIKKLREQGKVKPGLTLHGLRHTIGKVIADGGGGLIAIQNALQHKTAKMALHYSAEADKKAASLSTAPMVDSWLGLQNASSEDCKTPLPKQGKDNEFNG